MKKWKMTHEHGDLRIVTEEDLRHGTCVEWLADDIDDEYFGNKLYDLLNEILATLPIEAVLTLYAKVEGVDFKEVA